MISAFLSFDIHGICVVIRFKCPNCGRYYELSQLLRNIPLLCKGCGQRIDVPETSQEPEPLSPSVHEVPKQTVLKPKEVSAPAVAEPPPILEKEAIVKTPGATQPELEAETTKGIAVAESQPEMEAETTKGIAAKSTWIDDESTPSTQRMKPLSIVVDAMIGLFLLLVGSFLGEFLAEKSTADIWREAGTAFKFPPIDLLLWLAPPVTLILIYSLLIQRRKSLGAWLQRRSEQ